MKVTILRRTDLPTYPTPTEVVITRAITYQADMMPPRTIYIDKEKWTPDVERVEIAADIEKMKAEAPEMYEL
ncbi:hypothetical protein ES708_30713 [subsurface metagenome]